MARRNEDISKLERAFSKEGISLIEHISTFTSSDVGKLNDEDLLRYVAKYSRKSASRRRAIAELVRMDRSGVLEYIALTGAFRDTRKAAVKGLSRLSEVPSLKRLVQSEDPKLASDACDGLARCLDALIMNTDTGALELISKKSKRAKHRKLASNWLNKLVIVKMIKKIES